MKKLFSVFIAILVLCMPALAVSAEDYPLEFELSADGSYYLLSDVGSAKQTVVIPAEYNGRPVFGIKEDAKAFEKAANSLESLVLPETLYDIPALSLGLSNEKVFNIYENGKYIGTENNPYYALAGVVDTTATEFKVHKDTEIIAGWAFRGAVGLKKIELPDSLKYANHEALDIHDYETDPVTIEYTEYGNCLYLGTASNPYHLLVKAKNTEIADVEIHKDTKVIMPNALSNCKSIENVIIPGSVISVGKNAFYGCDALKEIKTAASLDSLKINELYVGLGDNVDIVLPPEQEVESNAESSTTDGGDSDNGKTDLTWVWVTVGVAAVIAVAAIVVVKFKKK